ncbi:MAG: hypothetical protein AAGB04_00275 [Pseudomonadota bacterium]
MENARLWQHPSFTIRALEGGPCEVQKDAWDAVTSATRLAMLHLDAPGHLFVTAVGSDVLQTGPDDFGFALYHQGIRHVAVAAGDAPDEFDGNRDDWLQEVQLSAAHEIVHYWQEMQGTLEATEANEVEAERIAYEVLGIEQPMTEA